MTPAPPKTLDRIRALLARAAHPTTPAEEARTSAHQAARLIARHAVSIGGAPEVTVRVSWGAREASEEWQEEGGYRHFRIYDAARAGTCQECRGGFKKGERIGWRNPIGPVHLRC